MKKNDQGYNLEDNWHGKLYDVARRALGKLTERYEKSEDTSSSSWRDDLNLEPWDEEDSTVQYLEGD